MILCPTCNGTISSRHDERLGEPILFCRTCKRYGVANCSSWIESHPQMLTVLKRLIRERNDDQARHELFLTSDINDPIWTKLSPGA